MPKGSTHRQRQLAAASSTKKDDGDPREKVYKTSRVLPMPTRKQKSDLLADSLKRKRKHRKRWKEPEAEAIMNMHFTAHSHGRKSFHAEMTLEIPQDSTLTLFYTISATMPTEALALRRVIETMESQKWFVYFRQKGVRFRVTGVLEDLYRGYL